MTVRSSHPAGRLMVEAAREQGWGVGNPGEAEVAHQLGTLGYTPRDVETQFRLGPYRLDFAIPAERIDIEADGWVHATRDVRRRDTRRDDAVKGWGWVVVRVDVERDDIAEQLRRHVPDCSRIKGYGETLRQVGFIFKAYLDQLQRRGIADPEAQLELIRDSLQQAREASISSLSKSGGT